MRNVSQLAKKIPLKRIGRVALVAISIGLMVRFVKYSLPEIRESLDGLRGGNVALLIAAVAVEVVWTVALSQVYRSGLKAVGGNVGHRNVLRISMASFSISRIVPGGGTVGSAWAARELVKAGNSAPRTVISMMASWWISMTSLSLVVTTAISVSVATGRIDMVYLAGPASTLAVFVAGALFFKRMLCSARVRAWFAARAASALSKFDVSSEQVEIELSEVSDGLTLRKILPVGGWAATSWIVDAAALALTFAAFGSTLDIGVLMVGYGLANLISALPELTPGWLGVLEATLAGIYGAFGVPAGTAVLAVLSYRLVSYWLPVLAGLIPAGTALNIRSWKPRFVARSAARARAHLERRTSWIGA